MKEKYDSIGVGYNLTRKADPYLVKKWQQHLQPKPAGTYLDIGCGTGNYTIALHDNTYSFIGVEPSAQMLEKAMAKCSSIEWLKGKAEAIPLPDIAVDGAIACLTIHHWSDLAAGFRELYRVLKRESTLIIFTSTPRQMHGYWLNHYFPKMLADSMQQMPAQAVVRQHLAKANFTNIQLDKYFVRPDLSDLFLYAGKQHPAMYLDPQIRKGISSFSAIANQKEVTEGLAKLKADIHSGKVKEWMEKYQNDEGDYLYIIAQKH